jgi:hypothetical protein
MLVASHTSDLAAAAACGLRTCYVSRLLEYGPGVVVEEPPAKGRFDLNGRGSARVVAPCGLLSLVPQGILGAPMLSWTMTNIHRENHGGLCCVAMYLVEHATLVGRAGRDPRRPPNVK